MDGRLILSTEKEKLEHENSAVLKTQKRFTEKGLGAYHPIVSFCFFGAVIVSSLLFIHPVYAYLSLIFAVVHACQLSGKKAVLVSLLAGLPMWLFMAAANPLFNHHGSTYLFYVEYNPVTLEAVIYGLVAAGMLTASVEWFFCYSEIVTTDKFLYIFGKLLPSVALIASMTLRLVPRLIAQAKIISETQRTIGRSWSGGSLKKRIKSSARTISILVSWALEDAVTTADSMRARGYGIGKRSNFSIFRFGKKDKKALAAILVLFAICLVSYFTGAGTILYYPKIEGLRFDPIAIFFYAAFALLSAVPTILTLREDAHWKFLK